MSAEHPAILFYRARDIDELVSALRDLGEVPSVRKASLHARGGLRDRAIFTDTRASAAAIPLPSPLVHPVVLDALAEAIGVAPEALRDVASGASQLVDGRPSSEEGGDPDEPQGVAGLARLAVRVLPSHPTELLFPHLLPVPPLAARAPSSILGIHPIDGILVSAMQRAQRLGALRRLDAPTLLLDAEVAILQGCLENLVAWLVNGEPASPAWLETPVRERARFLRMDEGEGLDDVALDAWAYAPRTPSGRDELRTYREHPWSSRSSLVLAPVLLDDHVLLVTRYGLATRENAGAWSSVLPVGPIRPIATDGRHVAFLGAHPRGNYLPETFVFDARTNRFIERWPETMPKRFVAGHWGEKALVIWDRERRRERLLRHSNDDDFGHHFASADGSLVWLADYPSEGILRVADGSTHVDLARLGLARASGVFPRAFAQTSAGPFRLFAKGKLFQDDRCVSAETERVTAVGFDRHGSRLALVSGGMLRVRTLAADGSLLEERAEPLPIAHDDFRLPKRLSNPVREDRLFGSFGTLRQVAHQPVAALVEHLGGEDIEDIEVSPTANLDAWADAVSMYARSRVDRAK